MKVIFITLLCCSLLLIPEKTQKTLPQDIALITLGVKDIKASAYFYGDVLGWDQTDQSSQAIMFYDLGGVQLCIYPVDLLAGDAGNNKKPDGFAGITLSHYTKSPQQVDAIFESLQKLGVAINVPPTLTNWGGYRGYFTDPDGYSWEVVYNPHHDPH